MKGIREKELEKSFKKALELTAEIGKQVRKNFELFKKKKEKIQKEINNGPGKTKGFII